VFIKIQEQVKPFPNIPISGSLSGIKISEKYEEYISMEWMVFSIEGSF